MRHLKMTFFLIAATLMGWASAQNEEGADVDSPDVAEPSPESESATAAAPGAQSHTVEPGDTLWNISQQYLGTPWYWPKVWSQNPEIANPHWIYPGNVIRFSPMGEEGPVRIDVSKATSTDDVAPVSGWDSEAAASEVLVSGQIGYVPRRAPRVMAGGFVTAKELDLGGQIEGAFSETEMLSFMDKVYVRFKSKEGLAVGREYVVYRRAQEPLKHPVTNARLGYLTEYVGIIKVTALTQPLVTAVVSKSFDELRLGDWVGPSDELIVKDIVLTRNERNVDGFVVAAMVPFLAHVGEHQLIVVDRGAADGIRRGNTFDISRKAGDELRGFINASSTARSKDLPNEVIGACVVVEVKDRASTCLITRAMREVMAGDLIQMKTTPKGETRASLQ